GEPLQHFEEVGGVAGVGVALLLEGEDGHGQLGQVLEGEVVEPAAPRQLDGGVEVVAPEAAAVADPHALHRSRVPRRPGPPLPPGGADAKLSGRARACLAGARSKPAGRWRSEEQAELEAEGLVVPAVAGEGPAVARVEVADAVPGQAEADLGVDDGLPP